MNSLEINGEPVDISPAVMKRIEKVAAEMELTLSDAVSFLLERVK